VDRGFGDAADRIQELFLAGRKEEAAAAVPDEYLDGGVLIGSRARIRERFAAWRDAGFTMLLMNVPSEEEMKLVVEIADG
jgi:alkanesulfonate monooxygenase SsuD/methylene tetrahydromethanopterin reductase-like flavin-dependent oxidoreductase (luciferase family)